MYDPAKCQFLFAFVFHWYSHTAPPYLTIQSLNYCFTNANTLTCSSVVDSTKLIHTLHCSSTAFVSCFLSEYSSSLNPCMLNGFPVTLPYISRSTTNKWFSVPCKLLKKSPQLL